MHRALAALIIILVVSGCSAEYQLKNTTRSTGYALGSNVGLSFILNPDKNTPDSIAVEILEVKTKYVYKEYASKINCENGCKFLLNWDGRKPDGSWPSGGRYYVSAIIDVNGLVYSDTVKFGLTD